MSDDLMKRYIEEQRLNNVEAVEKVCLYAMDLSSERDKLKKELSVLRAENEKLRAATTPICVGRRIIGILAKEGAWTSETGASVVAADELFCNDPYEVIEKLRAALKRW